MLGWLACRLCSQTARTMLGRHIAVHLLGCRFLKLSLFLQCRLMKCGSQKQAARRLLALKAFSFACELNHFLKERYKLLFDLLCLIVRHFAIKQCVRNKLLDVGDRSCNVCTLRYCLRFLAAIYRVLDLLCCHLCQRLWTGHEQLHYCFNHFVYFLQY